MACLCNDCPGYRGVTPCPCSCHYKPVYRKASLATALLLSFLSLLSCSSAELRKCGQKPLKIAVIDTGFGFRDLGHDARLCKFGHKDFSVDQQFVESYDTKAPIPLDIHGHGTNVAGIINGYANKAHIDYCLIIIKYYAEGQTGRQNLRAEAKAFQYAANIHADYINFSGGGPEQDKEEKDAVKQFLDQGGKLVSAAGNEHSDLDQPENAYYPAVYDSRIIVVGNEHKNGVRLDSSNYGKAVTRWEVGESVTACGITMTGTSQATATATGKIVAENGDKCDIGF